MLVVSENVSKKSKKDGSVFGPDSEESFNCMTPKCRDGIIA
jgi:hypothetical protein